MFFCLSSVSLWRKVLSVRLLRADSKADRQCGVSARLSAGKWLIINK